jgi:hypothetical protein
MKKNFYILFIFLSACVPPPSYISTAFAQTQSALPTSTVFPTKTSTPEYRAITWKELNLFLSNDHTNWNKYIPEKYMCVNFAMDLVANAQKQNINAWIVGVSFDCSIAGHTFVAFNTVDKGVVWIEPQYDYNYNAVEIGKPLCFEYDTSVCENFGLVTRIDQPLKCDPITRICSIDVNEKNSQLNETPNKCIITETK